MISFNQVDCYFKLLFLCIIYLTEPVVTATSSCANLLVHQTKTSGFIQTGGITQSGEYSRYANNMDCRWNISSNAMPELVFLRFKTNDQNDYLRVYDGGSWSSPLIGTYSGSSLPATITSATNSLYMRFISDASGNNYGFVVRYQGTTSNLFYFKGTVEGWGMGRGGGGGEQNTLPIVLSVFCQTIWKITALARLTNVY